VIKIGFYCSTQNLDVFVVLDAAFDHLMQRVMIKNT